MSRGLSRQQVQVLELLEKHPAKKKRRQSDAMLFSQIGNELYMIEDIEDDPSGLASHSAYTAARRSARSLAKRGLVEIWMRWFEYDPYTSVWLSSREGSPGARLLASVTLSDAGRAYLKELRRR